MKKILIFIGCVFVLFFIYIISSYRKEEKIVGEYSYNFLILQNGEKLKSNIEMIMEDGGGQKRFLKTDGAFIFKSEKPLARFAPAYLENLSSLVLEKKIGLEIKIIAADNPLSGFRNKAVFSFYYIDDEGDAYLDYCGRYQGVYVSVGLPFIFGDYSPNSGMANWKITDYKMKYEYNFFKDIWRHVTRVKYFFRKKLLHKNNIVKMVNLNRREEILEIPRRFQWVNWLIYWNGITENIYVITSLR